MKYLLLIAVIIVSSCASVNQYSPEEFTENIPKGASKVIITSDLTTTDLYNQVLMELTRSEVSFNTINQAVFIIRTDYKYIDSGTFIKINILVEEKGNYSRATMIGSWTYGQQNAVMFRSLESDNHSWFTAKWGNPFEKQSMAMAYIVNIANGLNHTEIAYK